MATTQRDVEAHLPLTPLSFQILLALVDEERHGYGIMKEIERRTKGRMSPATGPLYLAAQRLLGAIQQPLAGNLQSFRTERTRPVVWASPYLPHHLARLASHRP